MSLKKQHHKRSRATGGTPRAGWCWSHGVIWTLATRLSQATRGLRKSNHPSATRAHPPALGWLVTKILLLTLLPLLAITGYGYQLWIGNAISESSLKTARNAADLISKDLTLMMSLGATRAELRETIEHFSSHMPDYNVRILSTLPDVRHPMSTEHTPFDQRVLTSDAPMLEEMSNGLLKLGKPIIATPQCQPCHSSALPGQVSGAVIVTIDKAKLSVPMWQLAKGSLLILSLSLSLVTLWILVLLRSHIVAPIENLAAQIVGISQKGIPAGARVRIHECWPSELHGLGKSFNNALQQADIARQALLQTALRDPLTGLFNRRHFDAETSTTIADEVPFTLFMIDLNKFKQINDDLGHAAGDATLIAVARTLTSAARLSDCVVRLGGDEFAVIAPHLAIADAAEFASRIQQAVAETKIRAVSHDISPSCSIGYASFPVDGISIDALMALADSRMYTQKCAQSAS